MSEYTIAGGLLIVVAAVLLRACWRIGDKPMLWLPMNEYDAPPPAHEIRPWSAPAPKGFERKVVPFTRQNERVH